MNLLNQAKVRSVGAWLGIMFGSVRFAYIYPSVSRYHAIEVNCRLLFTAELTGVQFGNGNGMYDFELD